MPSMVVKARFIMICRSGLPYASTWSYWFAVEVTRSMSPNTGAPGRSGILGGSGLDESYIR